MFIVFFLMGRTDFSYHGRPAVIYGLSFFYNKKRASKGNNSYAFTYLSSARILPSDNENLVELSVVISPND